MSNASGRGRERVDWSLLALKRRKQITMENVSMMQDIPVENRLDIPTVQKEISAMNVRYGAHFTFFEILKNLNSRIKYQTTTP